MPGAKLPASLGFCLSGPPDLGHPILSSVLVRNPLMEPRECLGALAAEHRNLDPGAALGGLWLSKVSSVSSDP